MKSLPNSVKVLALGLALAPSMGRAIEIYRQDKAWLDLGARFQIQGVFENSVTTNYVAATSTATDTGNGPRDFTRIFLFQPENRLKLTAELDGIKFKFENAMGGEAYAGGNNLYDLLELNGEFPLGEHLSIVAGLSKMPYSNASAAYEENLLFTSHSQLFNMFFNAGYDTTLFGKLDLGLFDLILGAAQGVPNLPQRYLPETLQMPPPVFARLGFGTLKDDPTRFKQVGFEKDGKTQWGVHASGFWAADSNAGHGNLLSNMATQAEAPKGPFVNGNMMLSKNFNPFMGYTSGAGALADVYAQFWMANVDAQLRLPLAEDYLVFGAQYAVSQYINSYMNYPGKQPVINGVTYQYGQITAQGGEAYLGYETDQWWAATRVDVLLPDPMMMAKSGAKYVSIFGSDPIVELAFPVLGWKLNKFAKLTAELEHNFNATEAIDTDGIYQLKSVPVEAVLANFYHNPYQMSGRLMFQVAF